MQDAPKRPVEPATEQAAHARASWPGPIAQLLPRLTEMPRDTLIAFLALTALVIYGFWNSLILLPDYWEKPQYSHGWLVPLFAVALILMRGDARSVPSLWNVPSSARWSGLALLAAGLSMRLLSALAGVEIPDMVAFVPSLAGVVLLVGSWQMLVWFGPAIAFLIFMFPLPYRLERAVMPALQDIAAGGAEFIFQTFGYGVFRDGRTFLVGEQRLDVAEACSGLHMLTVFTAMTAALAIIIERPYWERALLFFSAIPIALIANIFRITLTALGSYYGGPKLMEFFHNEMVAAVYMMAIGGLLLWLEIVILGKLLIEQQPAAKPVRAPGRQAGRPANSESFTFERTREPSNR
jgi:exosortase